MIDKKIIEQLAKEIVTMYNKWCFKGKESPLEFIVRKIEESKDGPDEE